MMLQNSQLNISPDSFEFIFEIFNNFVLKSNFEFLQLRYNLLKVLKEVVNAVNRIVQILLHYFMVSLNEPFNQHHKSFIDNV